MKTQMMELKNENPKDEEDAIKNSKRVRLFSGSESNQHILFIHLQKLTAHIHPVKEVALQLRLLLSEKQLLVFVAEGVKLTDLQMK
ncbi:hypothetical protein LOK49_LG01G04251 [Camellia lanceoleosa]|uniref:Uncharacterized protein n=1 Tax=Camellia lanceoleosa TaxID=1840588 RepID=A0ACC0J1C1_9ERIC|nr:hypothetical protein LOK49_LG01G04251 [Camellia lanceoleosa]